MSRSSGAPAPQSPWLVEILARAAIATSFDVSLHLPAPPTDGCLELLTWRRQPIIHSLTRLTQVLCTAVACDRPRARARAPSVPAARGAASEGMRPLTSRRTAS